MYASISVDQELHSHLLVTFNASMLGKEICCNPWTRSNSLELVIARGWSLPLFVEFKNQLWLPMGHDVPLAATTGGEPLATGFSTATERLLACVGADVLLEGTFLVPSLIAAFERTRKGLLTSVNASVDQEVGRAKEGLSTARVGTNMWSSALMMSSAVIDEVTLRRKFTRAISNRAAIGLLFKAVHYVAMIALIFASNDRNHLTGQNFQSIGRI